MTGPTDTGPTDTGPTDTGPTETGPTETGPIATGPIEVLVRRLDPGVTLPTFAHPGDAGADLVTTVDVTIGPGERVRVPTGVAIALPTGYAAFVQPRSGLAHQFGVTVLNSPGTVDAGYRGELSVVLINSDPRTAVTLHRGDRIAQLVVLKLPAVVFREADLLPATARGEGGYGSTGGFAARPKP